MSPLESRYNRPKTRNNFWATIHSSLDSHRLRSWPNSGEFGTLSERRVSLASSSLPMLRSDSVLLTAAVCRVQGNPYLLMMFARVRCGRKEGSKNCLRTARARIPVNLAVVNLCRHAVASVTPADLSLYDSALIYRILAHKLYQPSYT